MPHCYSSNHSLPFLNDFSSRDRALAEKAIGKREDRQRKANASRGRKAEAHLDRSRKAVRDLLGAKKVAALREGLLRERLAFDDLGQPPQGLKRNYAKQKLASRRKVDALLRTLGPSRQKLARIIRDAAERAEDVLGPADGKTVAGYNLPKNLDKWTKLSPLHKFPLPWGPVLEDPSWSLYRPPFFGFLFSDDIVTSSNFRADWLLHLHPPSGLVGIEATMDCGDAGSFDFAHVIVESQIAVGFVPPVAGVIEVLIDAQSTMGTHRVEIEDEFGFSNAWCHQKNYLMMNVLHPNVPVPSLALMSSMDEDTGGDDVTTSRENLTRGQHYFAHLFSSGPVPAGQSVVVTAGTRTFDICRADDMELHSRTNFQWFINSVEVRISP